jgi:hypothetical protein
LNKNPWEKDLSNQLLCGQQGSSSDFIENLMHEPNVYPNPTNKSNIGNHCKQSKKNQEIGFHNKKAGRIISRSLCNISKAHVSSIESIKIHEHSDSEIERFLQ